MKDLDVQYQFNNRKATRINLKANRMLWVIYIVFIMIMVAIYVPLIMHVIYSPNYDGSISFGITGAFIVMFLGITNILLIIFQNKNVNYMIHRYNFLYNHHVQIKDNHVQLTLTSTTFNSSEHHEFDIQKTKKVGDIYIIYGDAHHYFYLPAEYVD